MCLSTWENPIWVFAATFHFTYLTYLIITSSARPLAFYTLNLPLQNMTGLTTNMTLISKRLDEPAQFQHV